MSDTARRTPNIEVLPDGRFRVSAPGDLAMGTKALSWDTAYPPALVQAILAVKGTATVDEIRRDEDDAYVAAHLRDDLFAYRSPESFAGGRLLDFGCGAGASTMCLSRLLPSTSIVGLDFRSDLLELAELRRRHYGCSRVRFACSPDPDTLPVDIGRFDFVVLSAVYEHLLPGERAPLMGRVWRLLNARGVLFLNQTPHRYWPIEMHTTRLPLINYLPDRLALAAARAFSPRVPGHESWQRLLRRGIRGGTEREILRLLERAGDGTPQLLQPIGLGLRDRIDLWYHVSNRARPHPLKKVLWRALKILRRLSGTTLVPHLALAIRKAA